MVPNTILSLPLSLPDPGRSPRVRTPMLRCARAMSRTDQCSRAASARSPATSAITPDAGSIRAYRAKASEPFRDVPPNDSGAASAAIPKFREIRSLPSGSRTFWCKLSFVSHSNFGASRAPDRATRDRLRQVRRSAAAFVKPRRSATRTKVASLFKPLSATSKTSPPGFQP